MNKHKQRSAVPALSRVESNCLRPGRCKLHLASVSKRPHAAWRIHTDHTLIETTHTKPAAAATGTRLAPTCTCVSTVERGGVAHWALVQRIFDSKRVEIPRSALERSARGRGAPCRAYIVSQIQMTPTAVCARTFNASVKSRAPLASMLRV